MNNEVSLNSVLAWACWAVSLIVLAYQTVLGPDVVPSLPGVIAAAAGATLHTRGFIMALAQREENAFEIGRDSARLRSMR